MNKLILLIIGFSLQCVFHASGQTANWSAISPALFPTNASGQIHGISRITQLKFHPTISTKMYAVSARGGLFVSTNGGTNWSIAPGCDAMPYSTFSSVCIDFTNDQILYLGAGDHNYYYSWGGATGVWKSTNGGLTFTQTSLNNRIIIDMVMDPTDHNVVVAITNSGIYKTLNGGSTWSLKTAGRAFDDLKQKTPVSRVLFAATTDSAFFRSTDFGDNWTQINSGIVLPAGVTNGDGCRIAVTPADTNVVYLAMVANSGLIYKSTNGGTSFTAIKTSTPPYLTYYDNLSTSSGQGDYNFGIGVDRVNANIVYVVAHNLWKSTNGGVSWTQMTNWWAEVHTDMHQIVTSPYNNNQLWNMNDGGVWLSNDAGNNWSPKSDGIYGYEIYHGSCSPTRRDMITIGTQDNGELYGTTAGWFTNRGGDWQSHGVFDYRANSSMVYYFNPDWGTVHIPKRRIVSGSDATYGLPSTVTDFTGIAFNRLNSDLAFIADTFIFRTTNLTAAAPAWTQLVNLNKKIMALHSSFADANRLYAITNDGFIHVSTNALSGAPAFTSHALPNSTNNAASITSIKNSPNTIYVTANTKVYRSSDNGATWTNVTYNLPSVNHVRIIADEYFSTNELVLIASNNAVYYKINTANAWTIYSTNLPSRTSIVDMSIYNDGTSNSLLRVATYGRGMWETPITNLHALASNFSADNTNPCPAGTVNFSDLSTGVVTSRSWTFTGGTPSSSTAANPSVVYNSTGTYSVSLTVSDGTSNSTSTKSNYISTTGANLPLTEGFETAADPPTGWKNIDNGTLGDQWLKTSVAGGFGNSSNSMMFDNYSWNIPGEKDELQAKREDFTGYNSVTLTFDVAYQVYTGFADSLAVLVSTNCGSTFTRIYLKGGANLSTAGSGTADFVPAAAQWRTETINLNAYAGSAGVMLAFQNINGYGNNLYLDNINVNATVAASAGIDKNICAGNSASIGMSPVTGVSYNWSPATGLTSSTSSNPQASPSVTTDYVLTATQPNSGIFNRDTVRVNVTPAVAAGVSITANPSGAVCLGTSTTFTAVPVNGGAAPIYQWLKNSILVGVGNSYTTTSLANRDTVKCILTSNAACVTGSPAISNSLLVTVNPNVTANVNISANPPGAICSGTNVTYSASPTNGGVSPTYQWLKNNANVGTGNTFMTTALATDDTVKCVMTSNASCVSGSPATSNSMVASVIPALPAGVDISADPPGAICTGTNVLFTATPANGGASPSYQWMKNNVFVGTGNIYSSTSLSTNDTITCTMLSSATCASGNPASSNSIVMNVNNCLTTLNLKIFIEGLYSTGGSMIPVLYNSSMSADPTASDSITVELWSPDNLNLPAHTTHAMVHSNGLASMQFAGIVSGNYYYIVTRHRNSMEIWSKNTVLFNSSIVNVDFTTP